MSAGVDRIAEVLAVELDEHGCEDDDEKRWPVAHHWAERVAEALHLDEMLVKEGENPPLYAISGWVRGPAVEPNPTVVMVTDQLRAGFVQSVIDQALRVDSDAVLAELLDLARADQSEFNDDIHRLAELTLQLHTSLAAGGPLPAAWRQP